MVRRIIIAVSALALSGCTPQKQGPEDLKERTAEATAQLKTDAKEVAEGVREGWNRDKPLDISKATRDELLSLPGITNQKANALIAGRPYDDAHQLVSRGILSEREYDRIKGRIGARSKVMKFR